MPRMQLNGQCYCLATVLQPLQAHPALAFIAEVVGEDDLVAVYLVTFQMKPSGRLPNIAGLTLNSEKSESVLIFGFCLSG